MPDGNAAVGWLQEHEGRTVFEGDVLRINHERGTGYDVQRGGWNFDPGRDTWLTEHVLARFEGRRVRVTIEDLGNSPLVRPRGA